MDWAWMLIIFVCQLAGENQRRIIMRNLRTWEEEVAETRMLVNFIKTKIRLSNEATIKNRALKFINPLDR